MSAVAFSRVDKLWHNLHTGKVSVSHRSTGKVTMRADWVEAVDASPLVSAAQWQRSRTAAADGGPKRSVHAWIKGMQVSHGDDCSPPSDVSRLRRITYNPARHESDSVPVFHYADTGEEWTGSARVLITGGYAYEVIR